MDEKPKKLWKYDDNYQYHVTIPTIDSENVDERRMEYVENVKNLAQEKIGVNLVMLKDLRITLKIGLVE
ncbi:hypothetical protein RhiirA4_404131 [Rhizophagus irregularis]|uniref:Uncharacterized protein n=1 Tax=Rhizophagus irregularis TaxID=588596 RepID=A0A2I1GNL8_9GLOM|nr:hypothetical protein RhiirA4_404131 [Rhizophagus irregularis]